VFGVQKEKKTRKKIYVIDVVVLEFVSKVERSEVCVNEWLEKDYSQRYEKSMLFFVCARRFCDGGIDEGEKSKKATLHAHSLRTIVVH
jgi:hypothetical protein